MYGHIAEINSKKGKAFPGVQFPGLLSLIKRTIKMEGGFYGRIKKESDRKIRK